MALLGAVASLFWMLLLLFSGGSLFLPWQDSRVLLFAFAAVIIITAGTLLLFLLTTPLSFLLFLEDLMMLMLPLLSLHAELGSCGEDFGHDALPDDCGPWLAIQ